MPLRFPNHHAGQGDHGDQVGDGHEAVEGVGDVPGQGQVHGGAHHNDDDEDDLVGPDGLGAEDELTGTGAVQRPAQHRGVGEQGQAHGDQQGAELVAEDGAEGGHVQAGVALDAVVQVQASALGGAEDGQTGQGADDQGCDESFTHPAEERLKKEAKTKYHLPARYILCVGSIEERKNVSLRLLKVFLKKNLADLELVHGQSLREDILYHLKLWMDVPRQ